MDSLAGVYGVGVLPGRSAGRAPDDRFPVDRRRVRQSDLSTRFRRRCVHSDSQCFTRKKLTFTNADSGAETTGHREGQSVRGLQPHGFEARVRRRRVGSVAVRYASLAVAPPASFFLRPTLTVSAFVFFRLTRLIASSFGKKLDLLPPLHPHPQCSPPLGREWAPLRVGRAQVHSQSARRGEGICEGVDEGLL